MAEAVQTWLAAAEISSGPLFRPVLKGGRLRAGDRAAAPRVSRHKSADVPSGYVRRWCHWRRPVVAMRFLTAHIR
jgi:hypothetical protein